MNQFILGIDAGATKTVACIKCLKSNQTWTVGAGPASLSTNLPMACKNIEAIANTLLNLANCAAEDTSMVCGAAGATNNASKARLTATLEPMNFNNFLITSDAITSLYGASRGHPMVVIAIGTGSVAMRLDSNGYKKQFGGWGLSAGDQGSGAYIGRAAVTAVLKDFDKDNFSIDEFTAEIFSVIGDEHQKISQWLKTVTSTQFASLAPLVFNFRSNNNIAKSIVDEAVLEIEQLINTARSNMQLAVCLTGGLATSILPLLSEEIKTHIISAKGDAVDGCLYLAEKFQPLQKKTQG